MMLSCNNCLVTYMNVAQSKTGIHIQFYSSKQIKNNHMPVQSQSLKTMLQTAHKDFAYQLLSLQIKIENSKDERNETLIQNLSKLIQLYMLGVQVLESHWDGRYRYFNDKIQSLMKKKHIIEELHVASTGHTDVPSQTLAEANKQMRDIRKNQHEINIFFNADQCDIRKVKEIVRKEQAKLTKFHNRLKMSLESQENLINERINRRKMKSQCYSARKFDITSNHADEKIKQVGNDDNDDIFVSDRARNKGCKNPQRRGSIEKNRQEIKL